MHPRERSAWKISFLHDWEINNHVRRMELARKKNCFLTNRKTNNYVGGIEN